MSKITNLLFPIILLWANMVSAGLKGLSGDQLFQRAQHALMGPEKLHEGSTQYALRCLETAYKKGHDQSTYALGCHHLHGDIVPQNTPEALKLLTPLAKAQHLPSVMELARLYDEGCIGLLPDKERAHTLFAIAARADDPYANYKMGVHHFFTNDHILAASQFSKASFSIPNAHYFLSWLWNKSGKSEEAEAALAEWKRKTHEQPHSLNELGTDIYEGYMTTEDPHGLELAHKFFTKAALSGLPSAVFNAGLTATEQYTRSQDLEYLQQAIWYFNHSKNLGDIRAQAQLAHMCLRGWCLPTSVEDYEADLQVLAQFGNLEAIEALQQMHQNGPVTEPAIKQEPTAEEIEQPNQVTVETTDPFIEETITDEDQQTELQQELPKSEDTQERDETREDTDEPALIIEDATHEPDEVQVSREQPTIVIEDAVTLVDQNPEIDEQSDDTAKQSGSNIEPTSAEVEKEQKVLSPNELYVKAQGLLKQNKARKAIVLLHDLFLQNHEPATVLLAQKLFKKNLTLYLEKLGNSQTKREFCEQLEANPALAHLIIGLYHGFSKKYVLVPDKNIAQSCLMKSANTEHAFAHWAAYWAAMQDKKNPERSNLLKRAADVDIVPAQLAYARHCFAIHNFKEGDGYLARAVQAGSSEALQEFINRKNKPATKLPEIHEELAMLGIAEEKSHPLLARAYLAGQLTNVDQEMLKPLATYVEQLLPTYERQQEGQKQGIKRRSKNQRRKQQREQQRQLTVRKRIRRQLAEHYQDTNESKAMEHWRQLANMNDIDGIKACARAYVDKKFTPNAKELDAWNSMLEKHDSPLYAEVLVQRATDIAETDRPLAKRMVKQAAQLGCQKANLFGGMLYLGDKEYKVAESFLLQLASCEQAEEAFNQLQNGTFFEPMKQKPSSYLGPAATSLSILYRKLAQLHPDEPSHKKHMVWFLTYGAQLGDTEGLLGLGYVLYRGINGFEEIPNREIVGEECLKRIAVKNDRARFYYAQLLYRQYEPTVENLKQVIRLLQEAIEEKQSTENPTLEQIEDYDDALRRIARDAPFFLLALITKNHIEPNTIDFPTQELVAIYQKMIPYCVQAFQRTHDVNFLRWVEHVGNYLSEHNEKATAQALQHTFRQLVEAYPREQWDDPFFVEFLASTYTDLDLKEKVTVLLAVKKKLGLKTLPNLFQESDDLYKQFKFAEALQCNKTILERAHRKKDKDLIRRTCNHIMVIANVAYRQLAGQLAAEVLHNSDKDRNVPLRKIEDDMQCVLNALKTVIEYPERFNQPTAFIMLYELAILTEKRFPEQQAVIYELLNTYFAKREVDLFNPRQPKDPEEVYAAGKLLQVNGHEEKAQKLFQLLTNYFKVRANVSTKQSRRKGKKPQRNVTLSESKGLYLLKTLHEIAQSSEDFEFLISRWHSYCGDLRERVTHELQTKPNLRTIHRFFRVYDDYSSTLFHARTSLETKPNEIAQYLLFNDSIRKTLGTIGKVYPEGPELKLMSEKAYSNYILNIAQLYRIRLANIPAQNLTKPQSGKQINWYGKALNSILTKKIDEQSFNHALSHLTTVNTIIAGTQHKLQQPKGIKDFRIIAKEFSQQIATHMTQICTQQQFTNNPDVFLSQVETITAFMAQANAHQTLRCYATSALFEMCQQINQAMTHTVFQQAPYKEKVENEIVPNVMKNMQPLMMAMITR